MIDTCCFPSGVSYVQEVIKASNAATDDNIIFIFSFLFFVSNSTLLYGKTRKIFLNIGIESGYIFRSW